MVKERMVYVRFKLKNGSYYFKYCTNEEVLWFKREYPNIEWI